MIRHFYSGGMLSPQQQLMTQPYAQSMLDPARGFVMNPISGTPTGFMPKPPQGYWVGNRFVLPPVPDMARHFASDLGQQPAGGTPGTQAPGMPAGQGGGAGAQFPGGPTGGPGDAGGLPGGAGGAGGLNQMGTPSNMSFGQGLMTALGGLSGAVGSGINSVVRDQYGLGPSTAGLFGTSQQIVRDKMGEGVVSGMKPADLPAQTTEAGVDLGPGRSANSIGSPDARQEAADLAAAMAAAQAVGGNQAGGSSPFDPGIGGFDPGPGGEYHKGGIIAHYDDGSEGVPSRRITAGGKGIGGWRGRVGYAGGGTVESAADAGMFRKWYAAQAAKTGINPDPYDPRHHYDYESAYAAGMEPDASGHWPSVYKAPDHPNRFINGVDTITGKPVGYAAGGQVGRASQDAEITPKQATDRAAMRAHQSADSQIQARASFARDVPWSDRTAEDWRDIANEQDRFGTEGGRDRSPTMGGYQGGGQVAPPDGTTANPPGPDDQAAYLQTGEGVITKAAVNHYGPQVIGALNRMAIPRGKLRGMLR